MEPTFFATAADLRAWLERHHEDAGELLVGFHKKATGRPSITWPESVDQALCFGWIDGVRRSLGPDAYTIRFTPRKPRSTWSAVNVARMQELLAAGLVHPAGRRAFERRGDDRTAIYSYEQRHTAQLPDDYARRLAADPAAAAFFEAQPPSYRRTAAHWVTSAKRAETRERRLAQLIEDCAQADGSGRCAAPDQACSMPDPARRSRPPARGGRPSLAAQRDDRLRGGSRLHARSGLHGGRGGRRGLRPRTAGARLGRRRARLRQRRDGAPPDRCGPPRHRDRPVARADRARAPARADLRVGSFVGEPVPDCDAVLAIGEVLNYLFDEGNTRAALPRLFAHVHAALRPGGLFVFDLAAPRRLHAARTWDTGPDWAVLVDTALDGDVLTRAITTFRRRGASWRRGDEVHRQRLYRPGEIVPLLRAAGFRVRTRRAYGDVSAGPGRHVYVARKPGAGAARRLLTSSTI